MKDKPTFDLAVNEFCKLAEPENVTTKYLSRAFGEMLAIKPSWTAAPDNVEEMNRWEREKNAISNKIWREKGVWMSNAAIIWYIRDVVEMFRLRKDEYRDQEALLFVPHCWHIKALRHLISLIKDSEFAFANDSPEFAAACDIENRLNAVQENSYLSRTGAYDVAILKVDGYSAHNSWGGIPAAGNAILVRKYETPEGKRAIVETTVTGMVQHFVEYNVFTGPDVLEELTDMRIIKSDGNTVTFNYCGGGHQVSVMRTYREDLMRKFDKDRRAVNLVLTTEQINYIENTLIPQIADKFPAKIKLPEIELM